MSKLLFLIPLLPAALAGEVHTLTLRQAVESALNQNPDLTLARLDEQKAAHEVRVAKDPFIPKVVVGSGLAYTSGFPMSIEGSAPSVFQARAVASVFDRQKSYRLAQAKEAARGAAIDTQARREQVVVETVDLYLTAERTAQEAEAVRRQVESLQKVEELVRLRVADGRELPLEAKRAALDVAKAKQRAEMLEADRLFTESSLAMVLGFPEGDRVRAVTEERSAPPLPATEEEAAERALENSKEIQKLQSSLLAKELEIRSHKAARLPKLDLVAQYGLFSRFNNYEDFFRKFERHNGQLGLSFQIPLLTGSASSAMAAQAEADTTRLRVQVHAARSRIALDARSAFREIQKAETGRDVARLELEVARESLTVLLARMEEGRASLREVEAARFQESEKWIAYFDSQHALERARFSLLKQTGELLAALR